MKLFNKIATALLALPLMAGLTACSDKHAEYTPAEQLSNAQVYFPTTLPTDFTLSTQENVLKLQIERVNTEGELVVPLTTTQNAESTAKLSVPASVKFADGQNSATINATYDPATVAYDDFNDVVITVGEESVTTPYGVSTYAFTVGIPAPWKTIGKATYTEGLVCSFFGVQDVPYLVTIQENETCPGFYRLVNPYGAAYPYNGEGDFDTTSDHYMYIHAENPEKVYVETFYSGMDWGYGEFIFGSIAGLRIGQGAPEQAEGYYGTLKDGEITFPVSSMLIAMADYKDGGLYTANKNGTWSVLLPGYVKADYSVSATASGIFTDLQGATSVVTYVEAGADVETVQAVVLPADADPSAVADAIAAGELEALEAEPGRVEVPFNSEELGASNLQVVVAVIVDGEVKSVDNSKFEYYGAGGNNPWKSLGVGLYTDDIIIPMFTSNGEAIAPITYEVEIQENTENPGLYRLVDPYGPEVYPYYEALAGIGCGMPAAGNYLYINATDPEGIYVEHQSLGVDLGDGDMGFLTEAAYYLSNYELDVLKQYGYTGRFVDGVIKFPSFRIMDQDGNDTGKVYQGYVSENGALASYVGLNSSIQFVMPDAVTPSAVKKAVKPARVGNLKYQGKTKVSAYNVNKQLVRSNLVSVK